MAAVVAVVAVVVMVAVALRWGTSAAAVVVPVVVAPDPAEALRIGPHLVPRLRTLPTVLRWAMFRDPRAVVHGPIFLLDRVAVAEISVRPAAVVRTLQGRRRAPAATSAAVRVGSARQCALRQTFLPQTDPHSHRVELLVAARTWAIVPALQRAPAQAIDQTWQTDLIWRTDLESGRADRQRVRDWVSISLAVIGRVSAT